jgi:nitronate monooxygenase
MAGGSDTPELVAAVSAGGGIGFIGAAYLAPEKILEAARSVRQRTDRPFGVNLFAPLATAADVGNTADFANAADFGNAADAVARIAPYYEALGLPPPTMPAAQGLPFDEQLAAALESGAAAFSFTFGLLPSGAIAAIKAGGLVLLGTATSVEEAVALEAAGVDAVVAQGSEAGGHRGTFMGDFQSAMIGTMALIPQVVDAVRVPVVASGGIMDGRGIAAALALGASAVQMGTAFLTCDEAGIPTVYKEQILRAHERATRLTRAFSGRFARGIVNRFMEEMDDRSENPSLRHAILPFPLQNALTRPLRTAAAQQGRSEFLSLWAGQGTRMARRQPAAELVRRLATETESAIRRLASRGADLASAQGDATDEPTNQD